jgi:hypothetical protein
MESRHGPIAESDFLFNCVIGADPSKLDKEKKDPLIEQMEKAVLEDKKPEETQEKPDQDESKPQ